MYRIIKASLFFFCSICFSLSVSSLLAQEPACTETVMQPRLAMNVGYFGEFFTHPGLVLGINYDLLQNPHHSLWTSFEAGGYVHPKNHWGFLANLMLTYQFTFNSGFFLETSLGGGYLHTFPDGKAYTVDGSTVTEVRHPGYPHVMPRFAIGMGYKFYKKSDYPFGITWNIGAFGQYPYNNTMLPHIYTQLSLVYALQ